MSFDGMNVEKLAQQHHQGNAAIAHCPNATSKWKNAPNTRTQSMANNMGHNIFDCKPADQSPCHLQITVGLPWILNMVHQDYAAASCERTWHTMTHQQWHTKSFIEASTSLGWSPQSAQLSNQHVLTWCRSCNVTAWHWARCWSGSCRVTDALICGWFNLTLSFKQKANGGKRTTSGTHRKSIKPGVLSQTEFQPSYAWKYADRIHLGDLSSRSSQTKETVTSCLATWPGNLMGIVSQPSRSWQCPLRVLSNSWEGH